MFSLINYCITSEKCSNTAIQEKYIAVVMHAVVCTFTDRFQRFAKMIVFPRTLCNLNFYL